MRNFLAAIDLHTRIATALAVVAAIAFYFSAKPAHAHFNYTYRVAMSLLRGRAGVVHKPPSWLNEFVPGKKRYYSVFPLGAVLATVPAALLAKMHIVHDWAARGTAALIAGGCVYFFYRLTFVREDLTIARRVLLALFPVFATWTWCNLGFAGAWQVALGFAVLGEAAALYYTLVRPRPLVAGAWLALAIGNRTEAIFTIPIFLILFTPQPLAWRSYVTRQQLLAFTRFLIVPAILLLLTACYNLARFGSPTEFGYARIPGVLKEPWYEHGLFSLHAIRWNAFQMLFRGWHDSVAFPYLRGDPFGGSIFFASPFLFLLFREGGKHTLLCWISIGALSFFLWLHGNPGGWQFSYRYAMILLPWMFLVILENGPAKLSIQEISLFVVSLLLNGLAVYEYLWTTMIHV